MTLPAASLPSSDRTDARQANPAAMQLAASPYDCYTDDGYGRKRVHLNRSYYGLYVPGMMWREVENFSSGGVCLVLASTLYDPKDYYHDYDEFVAVTRSQQRSS